MNLAEVPLKAVERLAVDPRRGGGDVSRLGGLLDRGEPLGFDIFADILHAWMSGNGGGKVRVAGICRHHTDALQDAGHCAIRGDDSVRETRAALTLAFGKNQVVAGGALSGDVKRLNARHDQSKD